MRRLAGLLATFAVIALLAAIVGAPARSADTYRVDAIFDTAKGIIPGQLVKIAGARVGTIADVRLTRDYKARIMMEVPRRFTFRSDASCNIQPEGLISENFVQCDPGTPAESELRGEGDLPPTVPVERTSVPVSITDLFRIFQADVRQRFTVAIAALGGGLAARGEELNAIIRRANPTLAAVRRLTRDLAEQREQLGRAVEDTDRLIAGLAPRSDDVADFIDQSRRVTEQTADHASEISESIRRLPPLLDATDAAISNLDRLAVAGRPLLANLRAAAPGLEQVVDRVGPFSEAARPALRRLGSTSDLGIGVAEDALPVVRLLRGFARSANPTGKELATLLTSLRDRGFVEYLNRFAYYAAVAMSRFDSRSHIIPAHVRMTFCSQFAEEPAEGCQSFFGPQRTAAARSAPRDRRAKPEASPTRPPTPRTAPAPQRDTPAVPKIPLLPELPKVLKPVTDLTDELTENLTKDLPAPLRDALQDPTLDRQALEDLADFLLGG